MVATGGIPLVKMIFASGKEQHTTRDGGHEQLISNGEQFKLAICERDKKQTMIGLRGISTNWF
jgi:hypothetical protein